MNPPKVVLGVVVVGAALIDGVKLGNAVFVPPKGVVVVEAGAAPKVVPKAGVVVVVVAGAPNGLVDGVVVGNPNVVEVDGVAPNGEVDVVVVPKGDGVAAAPRKRKREKERNN